MLRTMLPTMTAVVGILVTVLGPTPVNAQDFRLDFANSRYGFGIGYSRPAPMIYPQPAPVPNYGYGYSGYQPNQPYQSYQPYQAYQVPAQVPVPAPDYVQPPVEHRHMYHVMYRACHRDPWQCYTKVHCHEEAHRIVHRLEHRGYQARINHQ